MSLAISNDFASAGVGSTIVHGLKEAVKWLGHAVKVIYKEAVVPFCRAVWPVFVNCMKHLWQFLKTAPGLGTLTFCIGAGLGITLLTLADSSLMEGDHNELERFFMRVVAVVCFIFAGATLAVGITLGVV